MCRGHVQSDGYDPADVLGFGSSKKGAIAFVRGSGAGQAISLRSPASPAQSPQVKMATPMVQVPEHFPSRQEAQMHLCFFEFEFTSLSLLNVAQLADFYYNR